MYVVVAHLNTLDMGLTLFLFAALCAFLLAQRDEASARENSVMDAHCLGGHGRRSAHQRARGHCHTRCYAGALYAIQRDWRLWRGCTLITGLLLFLAITAPWFVLVSMRNPEFAWFFFVHEHFLRYTTKIHQRDEPWYYFIPLLIAGGLPWIIVMLDAAWNGWKAEIGKTFQARRFLLIWCAS